MRRDDKVVAVRTLRNDRGDEVPAGRQGRVLAVDDGWSTKYSAKFQAEGGFFGSSKEPVITGLSEDDIVAI